MHIEWGTKRKDGVLHGAFNMGHIEGTDIRVERHRSINNKWLYLLSDDQYTYLRVCPTEFETIEELEEAVFTWLVDSGRLSWLQ
jgi:alkyl hydroperoxide reductase subunit AhpC